MGLIKALQQFGERAFAAAGRPHDGNGLAGLDGQRQVFIYQRQMFAVAECEFVDADFAATVGVAGRDHRIGFDRRVHQVAQASH